MLLCIVPSVSLSAFAAGNSLATATAISTGTNYSGSITETNSKDVYKFTIPSSGRINIKLNAYIHKTNYYLYDGNGNTVWSATYQYWNETTEMYSMDSNIDLTKGTYYFAVEQNYGTGNYNFKIGFTSAGESFEETLNGSNQDIKNANTISLGTTYKGQIAENDNKDVYKFTIPSSGRINIKLNAYIYETNYYLYDGNGNTVWSSRNQYWNETTEMYSMDTNLDLTKGTYYFAVEQTYGTGNYNFKIGFTSAGESFEETLSGNNQDIKTANTITLSTTYKGQIAENDNKDMYKFTIPSSGRINIKLNAYIYRTSYYLYDGNGNTVWSLEYRYWNDTTEMYSMDSNIDLTKGTYYFAVEKYSGTGNYNFKIGFTSAGESFEETLSGNNQDIKTANTITLGTTYKGQIAENDNKDIYCFELTKSMCVNLNITAYIYCTNFYIYDGNGNTIWSRTYQYMDNTSGKYSLNEELALSAGKYYFAVEKRSGTGNYNFSIGHVAPKLETISNTSSGIKITWGMVSSAQSYNVYRKTYSNGKWSGWSAIKTGVTGTSYTDTTAKSGTTYTYTVRAKNAAGLSSYNTTGLKIKFLSTPKLTSISNGSGKVTVKWNKVAGAKGYYVYRSTYSNGKWSGWKKVATTSNNYYNDTNVSSGNYYKYTVRAYNGSYVSYYNTTGLKTKYLAVAPLKSAVSQSAGVKVTWGKVIGAKGYNIYRQTYSNGKWSGWSKIKTISSGSTVSYTDKSAKKGVTYKYTVRAISDSYLGYYNTKGLQVKDKY